MDCSSLKSILKALCRQKYQADIDVSHFRHNGLLGCHEVVGENKELGVNILSRSIVFRNKQLTSLY